MATPESNRTWGRMKVEETRCANCAHKDKLVLETRTGIEACRYWFAGECGGNNKGRNRETYEFKLWEWDGKTK